MTSQDERTPSESGRSRRRRPDAAVSNGDAVAPDGESVGSADQGDLWADAPEAPAALETDTAAVELTEVVVEPAVAPPEIAPPAPSRRRNAATPEPVETPVFEDEPVYEAEPAYYGDADYSMMRNPYVLAGLAVAGAIVLAIFVVIIFGSRGDGGSNDLGGLVVTGSEIPTQTSSVGLQARSLAVATIHEGPGSEYFGIGTLPSGREVSIIGRDEDAKWYQIIFGGAGLKGWVQASALRLPADVTDKVAVARYSPVPRPSVVQPTPVPPTAVPTENAQAAPDLRLATLGNGCPPNEPLTLTLSNVGSVPVNARQVRITVSSNAGVLFDTTQTVTLAPGQVVPFATGQLVRPPRTTATLVFVSAPQDNDPSNNVVICVVGSEGPGGGGSGGGTAVPPPIATPR